VGEEYRSWSSSLCSFLRLCLWIFRNKDMFSRWGVVSSSPNLQAGGPPLVGCPRLLIQYIRSVFYMLKSK
jgi:hypothetical protein